MKTKEMAQVIIMADRYKKRPSEIMNIENDYVAYCFDEAALYLESLVLDDKGKFRWNRVRWGGGKAENNKGLIEFIEKYS